MNKMMFIEKYAQHQWAVIPCYAPLNEGLCGCQNSECSSIAKHPITKNGSKDATTNIEQIRQWWTQWPDANVAVTTGRQSNLVVLDVDGAVGKESLNQLIYAHGPLPVTLTAITARGRHYYFVYPSGVQIKNSASKIGQNIDIRGDGGFVIAPPSRHASGHVYEWLDERLMPAELPGWLLELIKTPNTHKQESKAVIPYNGHQISDTFLQNVCDQIRNTPQGSRNDTLNRLSFMVGQRIASGAILQSEAEKQLLSAALACGLQFPEAKKND